MPPDELADKDYELIALGASLAAGCLPCTAYHARALRQAGATGDEAQLAAAVGLAVKRELLEVMAERAAGHIGVGEQRPTLSPADWSSPPALLIAIASATGAHSVPALVRHLATARRVGLSDADVKRAVEIGRLVRQQAARKVDEAANAASETSPTSLCGCDQSPTTPSPARQGTSGGCRA